MATLGHASGNEAVSSIDTTTQAARDHVQSMARRLVGARRPARETRGADSLKYISSLVRRPCHLPVAWWLRRRFEANDATSFGVGPNRNADYDISRLGEHIRPQVGPQFQFFNTASAKRLRHRQASSDAGRLGPVGCRTSLRRWLQPLAGGTLKARLGRQQFGFDLQRAVSVRDGPNVRQSYDRLVRL